MLYRSFASTGPKHEWNPMPCKLVIYCWHATLHFRCRATQVLELKSVHPDDLQPGWGEDENLGSEIELGWKVCRKSPNNWLPKSCLTSSFCWSTLVRCKACNNWYIKDSGDSIKNQYMEEFTQCASRCLEKSNSRWHTMMAGSKIAASEFQWGVSLPQLLLPRNQQVIPQWLHLTAPLSLLTIIHCTLPTVIADNYLLHRPHKWLQL